MDGGDNSTSVNSRGLHAGKIGTIMLAVVVFASLLHKL